MSRTLLRALLILILVALLLGLAVVAIRNGDLLHHQTAVPPDHGQVPEFAFTDTSGETIRRADLDGDYWIADFIFTRCAGTCPLLSSRMFAIQSALADDEPVRLVSVSVDPEFDTPEVMAAYAERFQAEPERWLFLTGDRHEIYTWIREGFRLGVEEASADQRAEGAEDFIHSTRLVLMDRESHIRGYYTGTREEEVDRLLADLRGLLAAEAQR